jgi:hypothetical protein
MASQSLDLLRAQRDLYGAALIRLIWYDHAARNPRQHRAHMHPDELRNAEQRIPAIWPLRL